MISLSGTLDQCEAASMLVSSVEVAVQDIEEEKKTYFEIATINVINERVTQN